MNIVLFNPECHTFGIFATLAGHFDSRTSIVIVRLLTRCKPSRGIIRRRSTSRRLVLRNDAFTSRVRVYPCVCTTSDSEGSIHPFRGPSVFPNYPQDLRRAGRRGARRGRTGRYVYCSKLSLLARVAAASHRVIFIIRPFVFSAAARPESNNSARRRPRERFSFSKFLSLSRSFLCALSSPVFLLPFFRNHLHTRRLHLFRPSPLSLVDCLSSRPPPSAPTSLPVVI